MRGLGVSSHYTKILKPHLDEICGDTKYVLKNTMDNGVIVHTDRIEDEKFSLINEIVDENRGNGKINTYNHNMEISWRDINKYAEFKTMQELYAVYPNFQDDLTSDGGWIYPLTSLTKATNQLIAPGIESIDNHWRSFRNMPAKYAYFYVPNLEYTENALLSGDKRNPSDVEIYAPKITRCARLITDSGYCIKKIKAYLPLLSNGTYLCWWNAGLSVFEGDLPSLSQGGGAFSKAQLNKGSTIRVLNSIPSYTSGSHPLDMGIHIDHQNDEEVLAAIANAEAKGWTLTVQWNGTPTSTASMLRFGQLIYAKASERELPDGTTERKLEWGHYVTNPEGYETFRSLASAYDYFNLEMPISEI